MPTTTNILLSVPAHGTNVDTWDADPINNNSAILDAIFGSVTTKSLTNAPVPLTTTESRVNILRFTGTLTGNVVITLGAVIKSWICENNTLGAFTILMQGSPGTGNKCALPPGSCQIYWDGTNVSFINLGIIGKYEDYPSAAIPAWVTTCTVPPYLLCDGTTFSAVTYPILNMILGGTTLPDSRGRVRYALNGGTGRLIAAGGIDGNTRFATGGNSSGLSIGQANLPNVNFGLSISDTRTWITSGNVIQPGGGPGVGAGVGIVSGTIGVVVNNGAIGGTAASGGIGTPLASVPDGYVGGIVMIRAA